MRGRPSCDVFIRMDRGIVENSGNLKRWLKSRGWNIGRRFSAGGRMDGGVNA